MLIDGKLLQGNSVPLSKLLSSELATILRRDGSVAMTGPLDLGGQRATNAGAPTSASDLVRLQDMYNLPWKEKVKCATTGNINLATIGTGTAIDGITVVAGDRVLVWKQTAGAENGIYIVAVGAWTRAADADSATELRGMFVQVEQGTTLADHRFALTTDNITVGTTALTIVDTGVGTPAAFPTSSNKQMPALLTTADGQSASATTLAAKPAQGSYLRIFVDGVAQSVGDGVKTKDFYFSADGGATAKTFANLAAGDGFYFNGSIAGFQLATTDTIDCDYVV